MQCMVAVREAALMLAVDHPNVVKLEGICVDPPEVSVDIVYSYDLHLHEPLCIVLCASRVLTCKDIDDGRSVCSSNTVHMET